MSGRIECRFSIVTAHERGYITGSFGGVRVPPLRDQLAAYVGYVGGTTGDWRTIAIALLIAKAHPVGEFGRPQLELEDYKVH